MFDGGGEYSSSFSADLDLVNTLTLSKKKKKKNNNKSTNNTRFSDDQIRSLETMFQSETKLEPRKKLQLASELGLRPRQVAIWFQNKRARWKSKQLERDFSILQANYNTLTSQFDNLKKEKQSLLTQLQKLNDLIEKSHKEGQCCRQEASGKSINIGGVSDTGGIIKSPEFDVKPNLFLDRSEYGVALLSDDDSSIKPAEYLGLDDEPELLNMEEPADSSLTSPEEWGSLESDGFLQDKPTSSYQWWDF